MGEHAGMKIKEWIATDLGEVSALLAQVSEDQCEALCERIVAATRVFVAGQGRSGWIMRMTAVRLMQVGLSAHVVGDATTPPIRSGDLLLIASGSGETSAPVSYARRAVEQGARVAVVTSQPASTLASLSDTVVFIPGGSTRANFAGNSRMPLAAALEQATLIVLDACIARIAEQTGQTQSSLMARHANLE
jgi:6-phospho-3-hexuloisomerase